MLTINFSYKNLIIFAGLSSFFALLLAYISQFGFNLQPCSLCLIQRKPFFAIISISILAIFLFKSNKYQKISLFACKILLFINILIAGYHVGVENKIFKGPKGCSTANDLNKINNIKDLEQALKVQSQAKCSEPEFIFLKISMAGWNLIYCSLSLIMLMILYKKSKSRISIQ